MLTRVKAEVEVNGVVTLLEPVRLKRRSRAIVTILDDKKKLDGNDKNPKKTNNDLKRLFGSVDLGHPTGTDNESIDADLAKEYAGSE